MSKQPQLDGQEHQDAPSQRIKVETDDFFNAVKGDQYNCALVWAIRRRFPEAQRVAVNTDRVAFTIDETRYVYPTTPQIVEHVIKPLDQGGEVSPCTVQLSNGWTKPKVHRSEEAEVKHRQNERIRTVKEKKGEHVPQSSSYKRLMVVNAE